MGHSRSSFQSVSSIEKNCLEGKPELLTGLTGRATRLPLHLKILCILGLFVTVYMGMTAWQIHEQVESMEQTLERQDGFRLGFDERALSGASGLAKNLIWGLVILVVIATITLISMNGLFLRQFRELTQAASDLPSRRSESRSNINNGGALGRCQHKGRADDAERVSSATVRQLLQAQEDERRRIARELHDELGKTAVSLLLSIQRECEYSEAEDRPCQGLESKLRHLVEEVQRLAWGMRPSVLDRYGLRSALEEYVQRMSNESGVSISFEYVQMADMERLPEPIETTLFRVAQEGVTNILRHSKATNASVVVLHQQKEIVLVVEDDGRGFDEERLVREGNDFRGVTGMKERVSLHGGEFLIESSPGEGTTIRSTIPEQRDT